MPSKQHFIISCLLLAFAQSGIAQDCKRQPMWVSSIGYDNARAGFSTNEQGVTGLAFVEFTQTEGAKNKVYQHPSWKKAGNMGAIAITDNGSIYAVAAPKINLLGNKPEDQNILWRINHKTQEMEAIANLPKAKPMSPENPYGLMGLVYDCKGILYATSLAGSDRANEVGRVFALSIKNDTYSIIDTLEDIDAMGVGLVQTAEGSRLFLGKTRSSEVVSIALDATSGKFVGAPRLEFSLEGLGPHGDDRAKKIRFDAAKNELSVKGISFFYNLSNPNQNLVETEYKFRWVAQRGWMRIF